MKKKNPGEEEEEEEEGLLYLKPYYFDIFLKKGKTLKHPKEGEEREEFLYIFSFFLREEKRERRERDHAPLENSLTRTTFCARALFRAARLSSLSFIASCEHCSATTRFDSRGEKGKG